MAKSQTPCATLGKSLSPSVPQFLSCKMGDDISLPYWGAGGINTPEVMRCSVTVGSTPCPRNYQTKWPDFPKMPAPKMHVENLDQAMGADPLDIWPL